MFKNLSPHGIRPQTENQTAPPTAAPAHPLTPVPPRRRLASDRPPLRRHPWPTPPPPPPLPTPVTSPSRAPPIAPPAPASPHASPAAPPPPPSWPSSAPTNSS